MLPNLHVKHSWELKGAGKYFLSQLYRPFKSSKADSKVKPYGCQAGTLIFLLANETRETLATLISKAIKSVLKKSHSALQKRSQTRKARLSMESGVMLHIKHIGVMQ